MARQGLLWVAILWWASLAWAEPYTPIPRWGHAATVLPNPPTLVFQGGKTDPTSGYSYASAPNSADTIILPLSSPFTASAAPLSILTPASAGPAYAWHCLAPLGVVDGTWKLLSFGGDPGFQAAGNKADSAWIVDLNPTRGFVNYTHEPEGWAGQPVRRIRHSCSAPAGGGTVFITGGQPTDGSGAILADVYAFSPATGLFATLPALPLGLFDHSSILLSNGTLLVFGGVQRAIDGPRVASMGIVYRLDTTLSGAAWLTLSIMGTVPPPRHGAATTLLGDGTVFLFGGAAQDSSTVLNDGWILNVDTLSWTQTLNDNSMSGRFDSVALDAGQGQIMVVGGYGANAPVDGGVHIINTASTPNIPATSYSPAQVASGSSNPDSSNTPNAASGEQPGTSTGGDGGTGSWVPVARPSDSPGPAYTPSSAVPSGSSTAIPSGIPIIPIDGVSGLSSAAKVVIGLFAGLILLVLAIVLILGWKGRTVFAGCCHRRDKGVHEKGEGSRTLLDPESGTAAPAPEPSRTPSRRNAAFAAIGKGISRAASKIRKVSNGEHDDYQKLNNGDLARRSTFARSVGRGIRRVPPPSPQRIPGLGTQIIGVDGQRYAEGKDGRYDPISRAPTAAWKPKPGEKWTTAAAIMSQEGDSTSGSSSQELAYRPPQLHDGGLQAPAIPALGQVPQPASQANYDTVTSMSSSARALSPSTDEAENSSHFDLAQTIRMDETGVLQPPLSPARDPVTNASPAVSSHTLGVRPHHELEEQDLSTMLHPANLSGPLAPVAIRSHLCHDDDLRVLIRVGHLETPSSPSPARALPSTPSPGPGRQLHIDTFAPPIRPYVERDSANSSYRSSRSVANVQLLGDVSHEGVAEDTPRELVIRNLVTPPPHENDSVQADGLPDLSAFDQTPDLSFSSFPPIAAGSLGEPTNPELPGLNPVMSGTEGMHSNVSLSAVMSSAVNALEPPHEEYRLSSPVIPAEIFSATTGVMAPVTVVQSQRSSSFALKETEMLTREAATSPPRTGSPFEAPIPPWGAQAASPTSESAQSAALASSDGLPRNGTDLAVASSASPAIGSSEARRRAVSAASFGLSKSSPLGPQDAPSVESHGTGYADSMYTTTSHSNIAPSDERAPPNSSSDLPEMPSITEGQTHKSVSPDSSVSGQAAPPPSPTPRRTLTMSSEVKVRGLPATPRKLKAHDAASAASTPTRTQQLSSSVSEHGVVGSQREDINRTGLPLSRGVNDLVTFFEPQSKLAELTESSPVTRRTRSETGQSEATGIASALGSPARPKSTIAVSSHGSPTVSMRVKQFSRTSDDGDESASSPASKKAPALRRVQVSSNRSLSVANPDPPKDT